MRKKTDYAKEAWKRIEDKRRTEFANEVFEEVKKELPEYLADELEIKESSTGDEPNENFIMTFKRHGEDFPVYLIEFIDAGINDDPRWFAIEDFNVDNPDKWDNYERLFLIWKKETAYKDCVLMDESGAIFRSIEKAIEFKRFVDDTLKEEREERRRAANKAINEILSCQSYGMQLIRELVEQVGGHMDIDLSLDINDGQWGTRDFVSIYNGENPSEVYMRTDEGEEVRVEYDQVIYILEHLSNI